MSYAITFLFAFGFALSLAISGFMIYAGVGDIPETRSSHKSTTPTSGGLGIIAALGGIFLLYPALHPGSEALPEWPALLSLIFAMGLLGFMDDLFSIVARAKFLIIAILAVLAVWLIGPVTQIPFVYFDLELPYWAGFAGSVLWVFVVVNIVNFMDGANGLMPSVMIIACTGLAVVCERLGVRELAILPLAIAAGLAGLLPYNMRMKAQIFAGDVGSLTAGFGFAVTALMLCQTAPKASPVFIGPVLILPFLADSLLTMGRRAKRKENLLEAHRSHLYQRLIAQGYSHIFVSCLYGVAAIGLVGFTVLAVQGGWHKFTLFVVWPALCLSLVYYMWSRRLDPKESS